MTTTFCFILSIISLCSVTLAALPTLHVAPTGRDTANGGSQTPFLTLNKAVEAARATGSKRIILHSGNYPLRAPIVLTSLDSGLTIEVAKNEKATLLGGKLIGGWKQDGKFWSADLPKALNRVWDFRLLVVNGKWKSRARYPEKGTLTHESIFEVPWMSTTGGGWKRPPTDDELTHLKYKTGDIGDWLDVNNAEITVYHMWDESVVGLKANDSAARTLTFTNPGGHPAGAFGVQKYVVWNVKEGMTRPGQWYLDRTAGKVIYWPLPSEDIRTVKVWAPTMETVITINGSSEKPAENITLSGLNITLTNTPMKTGGFGASAFQGALSLSNTRTCRINGVTIFNVAGQGINAWGCKDLQIENCLVRHVGASGIKAEGENLLVSDCLIHDNGMLYPSGIGVMISGKNSILQHCEIHDTPYSAVVGGGENARYEYNLIYHAMKELHDGAGIYVGFNKGMIMRGNIIRDIDDTGGYGASAYYLDEQAVDCLVEGNLSVNVSRPTQNHMARNNIIRNNVFIMAGDSDTSWARCSGYTLEHNIYYAKGAITLRYPEKGITSMPKNIIYSAAGKVESETLFDYNGKGKQPFVAKDGTLLDDPLFMNILKGDYRFKPRSPAIKLGIKPLELSKTGMLTPKPADK